MHHGDRIRMTHARRCATAAVLALAGLLAGCAAPTSVPSVAPTASAAPTAAPTPSPAAAASPTAAPAATADPMAGWQLIQPESGRTQFRIPADWSADVSFEEFDGEPGDGVVVRRPDGQPLLRFSQAPGDVGGLCTVEGSDGISTPAPPDGVLLDREPIVLDTQGSPLEDLAVGAVAVALDDGRWIFGMGITEEARLQEPLGCPFYFVAGGPAAAGALGGLLSFGTQSQLAVEPDGAIWVVESLEAARAYAETDEYATLKRILLSLETRI